MDFTLRKYRQLLVAFQQANYRFLTFERYCQNRLQLSDNERFVILRHDVDLRAECSLETAKIEHQLGICASYYFRVVPQSDRPEIIRKIADLGHEIGYHYEDMAICGGDVDRAKLHFERNLTYFRQFYPVKTICMHGAPRSRFDGKELWKFIDYQQFGVIGEPYFDCDFGKLFYISDTGRRWDGFRVSLRDKIPIHQERWSALGWQFHATDDAISAIERGTFPPQLMMTTHPQRWTDNRFLWFRELVLQNLKNVVKYLIIRLKRK